MERGTLRGHASCGGMSNRRHNMTCDWHTACLKGKNNGRVYSQEPINSLCSPDFNTTNDIDTYKAFPGVLTYILSHLTLWRELISLQSDRRTIYWASPGTHHCWMARGISEREILPIVFYANEHNGIRSGYPVTQ